MPEYFCTKFCSFVHSLCAVFTRHNVKLTETQNLRMNFTTEQKDDFIIKVTEQQAPPLL